MRDMPHSDNRMQTLDVCRCLCVAQASDDADFRLTQGLLSELGVAENGADSLVADSLADDDDTEQQQGIQLADEATKNQVRSVPCPCSSSL